MKKVFLSLLLASLVMVSFQSCNDKDDDPKGGKEEKTELTLKGNIIISPHVQPFDESATVYAYASFDDEKTESRELLGEAKIKNNKFKLELKKPSDNILTNAYTEDMQENNITISNKDAKLTMVPSLEVKQKGDFYGSLMYSNTNFMTASIEAQKTGIMKINVIMYTYADRSTNISGTYTEDDDDVTTNYKLNLQLKKGWNFVKLHTEVSVKGDTENKTEMTTISSVTSDYKWVFTGGAYSAPEQIKSPF